MNQNNLPWDMPSSQKRAELDKAVHADLAQLREHITLGVAFHGILRRGIVVAEAFLRVATEDGEGKSPQIEPVDEALVVEALTQVVKLGRVQMRHTDVPFDMPAMIDRIDAYRVMLIVARYEADLAAKGAFG